MLDYYSIMASQILSQAIITIVMFTLWKDNKDRVPGLNYWMLNLIFQTLGQALFLMTNRSISAVAGLFGNTFILTGAVFFFFGLAAFNGTTIRKKGFYLSIAAYFIVSACITLILKHEILNTLLFNAAVLILFISYLKILFHKHAGWHRKIYRLLGIIYIIFSATYIIRITNLLISLTKESEDIFIKDSKAAVLLLIATLLLAVVNYIIIILINRSLIYELEQDAVQRNEMLIQMKYLAETDSLTGLANRMTIEQRLLKEISSDSTSESACAVILFDLDNFKQINDTYGHDEGDRVLLKTAAMLQDEYKDTPHTAGRWGGDEFLLIISNESNTEIERIAENILTKIRMIISDKDYRLSVSIGWSRCTKEDSQSSLLKKADISLYRAKSSGKNRVCSVLTINQSEPGITE
jgi:diguanylate cyclase (GGDEF)-like protein